MLLFPRIIAQHCRYYFIILKLLNMSQGSHNIEFNPVTRETRCVYCGAIPPFAGFTGTCPCNTFSVPPEVAYTVVGAVASAPTANVRERLLPFRVPVGTPFVDMLKTSLSFKIPIIDGTIINQYPAIFEYGEVEYGVSVDMFLEHRLLSYTSVIPVVALDAGWQIPLKEITNALILFDEYDVPNRQGFRPRFTAMCQNCVVMVGEARVGLLEMMQTASKLTENFHSSAFKLFPKGCVSIPGIMTCNESIALYAITFNHHRFSQTLVQQYNVAELSGRVKFIVDLFKILIWILSQVAPTEGAHLVPDVRRKTRNDHHVTLLKEGLLKEFSGRRQQPLNIQTMAAIYALKLPNVEHGKVNGNSSILITRVGSRLKDAMCARQLDTHEVLNQIRLGIDQLHAHGYAHGDLCVDNIFVDDAGDDAVVFIGGLGQCQTTDEKPAVRIRRADMKANSAEELDNLQFEKLRDELSTI